MWRSGGSLRELFQRQWEGKAPSPWPKHTRELGLSFCSFLLKALIPAQIQILLKKFTVWAIVSHLITYYGSFYVFHLGESSWRSWCPRVERSGVYRGGEVTWATSLFDIGLALLCVLSGVSCLFFFFFTYEKVRSAIHCLPQNRLIHLQEGAQRALASVFP